MKLGLERLLLLKAIDKVSKEKQSVADSVKIVDIMEELKKERNTVAKALTDAKKDGLVDNPIRGCWKLTEEGKEVLQKFDV